MIWAIFAAVFVAGTLAGIVIAALLADLHVRDEIERAYNLGCTIGERRMEQLVPFPAPRKRS